jgi:hypothetical protein
MKKLGGFVVAVALTVAAPAFAAAPSGGNSIAEGAKSLSFGIPSGGNPHASGAAGLWMVVKQNINMGFNVGLAYDSDSSDYDLLLAPAVRYYTATDGEVLPFFLGQVNLRLHDTSIGTTSNTDPHLALIGGLGLEWFVTKQFSVAGAVGVGLDVLRKDQGLDGLGLGTFTGNLSAQIYQ